MCVVLLLTFHGEGPHDVAVELEPRLPHLVLRFYSETAELLLHQGAVMRDVLRHLSKQNVKT